MGNLCHCKNNPISSLFLSFVPSILFFGFCSYGANTITQGQVLRDGQTLVSADGSFELGFFSPSNSSLRYVGIWYSNISVQSVVWVANRNAPISHRNGLLTIGNNGDLMVLDGKESLLWSSNTTIPSTNYTAVLHDDGNLEIRGSSSFPGPNRTCWQSFDHPTDTYLPGMRVLVNRRLGETPFFTSWKSNNDPSTGSYSMGVDPRAAPQIVIWEGERRLWRSGHWNGLIFIGVPSMAAFYYYGFKLSNADSLGNMYFTYAPFNNSDTFKFRITWDGYEKSFRWDEGNNKWDVLQWEPANDCDLYNTCGVHGFCNRKRNPICDCLQGFEPKYPDRWQNGNWSGGCVRKSQLQCERNGSLIGEDGFLKVENVKLPDFADLVGFDKQGCENHCMKNCSCRAYAYVDGIGCMAWADELIDVQQFSQGGNTLFIRIASSDLGKSRNLSGLQIAAIVIGGVTLLCILLFCFWQFRGNMKVLQKKRENNEGLTISLRKSRESSMEISGSTEIVGKGNLVNAPDLSIFSYDLVASATNFFSEENKLGQGGFGPVYKGMLYGGQEIAVKKLSRKSGQGMEEFKTEIMLMAKLQHRNLVRILGCCMHGEEKMLLYEYMPNKSLDRFIFDPSKREELDWRKRLTIIEGIARGLLYLHRDARCRIIHRDLKASNILLDQEMNPKISDFGMAKIFGGDQDQANTNRVVGTYGYMSPEYAMDGFFSEKSDVYSFGVLMLEVISGRRNTSFRFSEHMSLIEYAWKLRSEGRAPELLDSSIANSSPSNEVLRCVHIGLLCVQDSAVYRPIMSQVVLWLESGGIPLPIPKEPTLRYSSFHSFIDIDCQKGVDENIASSNNVTITMMVGR